MLSVGILGVTGFMGSLYARGLLKAHRSGQLRCVILHRPESDLSRYPTNIEKRSLDLEHGELADAADKMKDLQVVVSAISWRTTDAQYRIVDALKGSEQLVTFFPSEYATPQNEEYLASPFAKHSREKLKLAEYCATQGVPCTVLANATVPSIMFNFGPNPTFDVAGNKLQLYWPLGNGTRGLTSETFSGEAIVHLLLHRLTDLPSRSFSLVEVSFSAQDLIAVFKKLHNGHEPTIVKYTEEEYQRDIHDNFLSSLGAAGKKGLSVGVKWPGEIVSSLPGWQEKTLEDYVKGSLEGEPATLANFKDVDLSKD